MLNLSRPRFVAALALAILTVTAVSLARAQAIPETALQHQISRLDLGVTAIGQITKDVTGTNYLNESITQHASTTVGFLATLRYVKSPLIGFEGNYSQARYTQNYTKHIIGGAQAKATEYSLGYVAHTPSILGLKPFAAIGVGSMAFRPTAGGGQGLLAQARMVYYYNVGIDDALFSKHFGVRLHLRQAFYKAPDFGANYLTIQKHTNTLEPGVGFFVKF
jgi:hypothetical protein